MLESLLCSNLRSLWDVLRLEPEIFTFWIGMCGAAPWMLHEMSAEGWNSMRKKLDELRSESMKFDFRSVPTQIDRIFVQIGRHGVPSTDRIVITQIFSDLGNRLKEEIQHPVVLIIPAETRRLYDDPTREWRVVTDRYSTPQFLEDVYEAGRCLATDRFTACVFHLMRIVEAAVLDLQWILGKEDPKAHFGSVVQKLEQLTQKARYEELPETVKPHIPFLRNILPQFHAVKDSWRNRVAHVGARILPTDGYTEESTRAVYSATLELMRKLSIEAPNKSGMIGT